MTKFISMLMLVVAITLTPLAHAQGCDPRYFNRQCQPYFTGLSNVDPALAHPANRYPVGYPGTVGAWGPNGVWMPGGPVQGMTDVWGNAGFRNGEVYGSVGFRTFDPNTNTVYGGNIYGDTFGNSAGNIGFSTRR